jgi:hypothetical protein
MAGRYGPVKEINVPLIVWTNEKIVRAFKNIGTS